MCCSLWAQRLRFGAIGFVDDYNKVVRRRNLGLTPKMKFGLQVLTCVLVGITLLNLQARRVQRSSACLLKRLRPNLVIKPLLGRDYIWTLAYVSFVLFLVLVIVGCSNTVNLTDGLNRLAIGCVLVSSVALTSLTFQATRNSPSIWKFRKFRTRASWLFFAARWSVHRSVSFGTTRIPRKCLWATSVRLPSVEQWVWLQ